MNKFLITLFTAFLAIQVNANAASETIRIKATILSSDSVFHKKNSSTYEAISQEVKSKVQVSGTGDFQSINQESNSTDNTVVGIDYNGHMYVNLVQEGNNTYLAIDSLFDDKVEGVDVKVSNKYQVPVEFTKGTWADYKAGTNVELIVTEQGRKIMAENFTAKVRQVFKNLRSKLESLLEGQATMSEIKTEPVTTKGKTLIKGDLNRLEIHGEGETVVTLSFEVTI